MALEDLSTNIRTARKARGLSQEAVARRADISLNLMGRIELGSVRNPHYTTIHGIARALGMTVDELVEGSPGKASAPPDTGPPQVSKEDLAAQGIPVSAHEVEEINDTIMSLWRLGQGEKVVSRIGHADVDTNRILMLVHLVLDTPDVVTPAAAGVLNQGMRRHLKVV
jgi:transcriptional regulator with XRE-family HTH domain